MRNTILTLFGLLPFLAAGQCGMFYRYHPFGTCTEGWVDINCSVPMDSIVWSTGDVMLTLGSSPALPPGTHTWQVYSSGEVIQTGEVEMEQLEWQIADAHLSWTGGGAMISVGAVEVPYCTSMSQTPCCVPVDSLTYLRLVQDGATEMVTESCYGCTGYNWGNGPCGYPGASWFANVPTGHTYTVRLYDLACGNVIDLQAMLVAHSCDNLVLSIEEVGTEPNAMTGEVHLLEAVPDVTEPLPLQGTVTGTARLLRGLDGFEQVGDVLNGVASASWTDLDTGYYRVSFIPDAQCNHVTQVVHVSTSTSIGPEAEAPGAVLQVGLTADRDRITVRTTQGIASHVEMLDALGRKVPIRKLADGPYHIGAAVPGTYIVRAMVSGAMVTAKFIVP